MIYGWYKTCYIYGFNDNYCSRNRYWKKWAVTSKLRNFIIMDFIGRVQKVSGLVINFWIQVIFFQEIRIRIQFNLISIQNNTIVCGYCLINFKFAFLVLCFHEKYVVRLDTQGKERRLSSWKEKIIYKKVVFKISSFQFSVTIA